MWSAFSPSALWVTVVASALTCWAILLFNMNCDGRNIFGQVIFRSRDRELTMLHSEQMYRCQFLCSSRDYT